MISTWSFVSTLFEVCFGDNVWRNGTALIDWITQQNRYFIHSLRFLFIEKLLARIVPSPTAKSIDWSITVMRGMFTVSWQIVNSFQSLDLFIFYTHPKILLQGVSVGSNPPVAQVRNKLKLAGIELNFTTELENFHFLLTTLCGKTLLFTRALPPQSKVTKE